MANEIKEIVSNGTTYPILDNNAVHTSDIATNWTSPTTSTVPNTNLVDSRLKVDETNILYTMNRTGKNILNPSSGDSQNNNITFTDNGNFTWNVSGTDTTGNSASRTVGTVTFNTAGQYVIAGCPSGGGAAAYELELQTDSVLARDYGSGTTFTPTVGVEYSVKIIVRSPATLTTPIKFKPMICKKDFWDASTDFETPSLPNYDLTRLEAEDRAGLVECVDGGAKNVLQNVATTKTENNVTFTVNADGSVKVQTTSAGASAGTNLSLTGAYISNKYGGYVISGVSASIPNSIYLYVAYSNNGTSESRHDEVKTGNTLIIDGSYSHIQILLRVTSGTIATTALTIYPMICTKAAFGVSNKFVPYRPSWDSIYSTLKCDAKYAKVPVSTSYSLIGSVQTKGNRVCRITVTQEYTAVAPTGLILSKSNQSSDFNTLTNRLAPPVETTTDDTTLTISALCYYTYDRVVYIWAKAKTASTNGNNFMALCEHFGDIDGVKTSMT